MPETPPIPRSDATARRALGFGANAELYDRIRPGYPGRLVDDLLAGDPRLIVDVGCGTGRAARLLIGDGRRVVGVEPDPRMAEVAVTHGIDVEVATFETWDSSGRLFDLLTSAQAWHWVDPVAGARRAGEVLRPGGRFAAFWNVMVHRPDVRAVFDDVYGRLAPDLLRTSVVLGVLATVQGRIDPAGAALEAAPFDAVGRRTYGSSRDYRVEEWVALARTHSDHQLLADDHLEALLADLAAALHRLGPSITVDFRTEVLGAVRR